MHTWLCASADTRVAVAAPMIGVQYFMWVHTLYLQQIWNETYELQQAAWGVCITRLHGSLCITLLSVGLPPHIPAISPTSRTSTHGRLWHLRWAIENTSWHGRVASIPLVFEAARHDLGQEEVGEEVVEAVWHKLLPGTTTWLWHALCD